MKKSTLIIFTFALAVGLASCRDGAQQNSAQGTTEEIQEANRLDSISNELEKTKQSLEEETLLLKEALDAL